MKKVVIDNITYNVPETWDEITVKQQLQFETLLKENDDLKPLCALAGYLGHDIDHFKRINTSVSKKLLSHLNFLSEPLPSEPVESFVHRGQKYSVMPTLLECQTQDYVSLEVLRMNYKDRLYLALPKIIAILAKKEIEPNRYESLDEYDVNKRSVEFEDLPITVANRLWVFFWANYRLSEIGLNQLLHHKNEVLIESIKSMRNLTIGRGGMGWSSRWQMARLKYWISYIEKNWKKYYSSLPSEMRKPD